MKKQKIAYYAYVLSLMILILGLSISKSFMSIGVIGLAVAWVINGDYKISLSRYWRRKDIFIFSFCYSIFILAAISSDNWTETFRLLKLRLPIFAIPFFINGIHKFDFKTTRFLLNYLLFSTFFTTFVGLGMFINDSNSFQENARGLSSFISSIRLSTLLVFCICLIGWMIHRKPKLLYFNRIFYILIACWFFAFILLMKSLNGLFILAFIAWATSIIFIFYFKTRSRKVIFFIVSIFCPVLVITLFVSEYIEFYNYEKVDFASLQQYTKEGNLYLHENNGDVENGHYVRIYISDVELEQEWTKKSDSTYQNKREILIRYMSSKGLRKDREGFAQLTDKDIKNVEKNVPNYRFANPLNIRGRIYETFWELEKYERTGDPNGKSLSTRLQLWKTCIKMIKENGITGYGEHNIKEILRVEYEKTAPPMDNPNRMRPHNQFLYILLIGGYISLIVFVFCIFQPFLSPNRMWYMTFVVLCIGFLAMLNDDTLNTQAGISQFSLLFTLFSANILTFNKNHRKL